jgi:hypothetical protein
MNRNTWRLAGVALALTLVSGCCNPDRPGLFARIRERRMANEQAKCVPCAQNREIPVIDAGVVGAPIVPSGDGRCPCQGRPGPMIEGSPELIMPQRTPDNAIPVPSRPTPGAMPPGNATPNPAGPSGEQTGLRKGASPPVTKPLISQ